MTAERFPASGLPTNSQFFGLCADSHNAKNRIFFGSLEAGTNNALIYTLLANCRAQQLDSEDYLVEILKRLPHNATPGQAAALTPARIVAERRATIEAEEIA